MFENSSQHSQGLYDTGDLILNMYISVKNCQHLKRPYDICYGARQIYSMEQKIFVRLSL